MEERAADRVTVPDVVGMPYHVGRDLAAEAGVSLANPDPDGPPIGALAWPGLFYITSQHPPPGTEVYRWDPVIIDIIEHGGASSGVGPPGPGPPPSDAAQTADVPEPDYIVDLTRDDDRP